MIMSTAYDKNNEETFGVGEESFITIPITGGLILRHFRFKHGVKVLGIQFALPISLYDALKSTPDFEILFNCVQCNRETLWPPSIQLSINVTPVDIDRGTDIFTHRPIFVKRFCRHGLNTIEITAADCCCSHLFILRFVYRPKLLNVMRDCMVPWRECVAKLKRAISATFGSNGKMEKPGFLQIPLKCPISLKQITLPIRGKQCQHFASFDLYAYLKVNLIRESWECPVCMKTVSLANMVIDEYLWAILKQITGDGYEYLLFDSEAIWQVNRLPGKELFPNPNPINLPLSSRITTIPRIENSLGMGRLLFPEASSFSSNSLPTRGNPSSYSQTASNKNMKRSRNSGNSSPSIGNSSPSIGYSSASTGNNSSIIGNSSPSIGFSSPSIGFSSPSIGFCSSSIGFSSPSNGNSSPSNRNRSSSNANNSPDNNNMSDNENSTNVCNNNLETSSIETQANLNDEDSMEKLAFSSFTDSDDETANDLKNLTANIVGQMASLDIDLESHTSSNP